MLCAWSNFVNLNNEEKMFQNPEKNKPVKKKCFVKISMLHHDGR